MEGAWQWTLVYSYLKLSSGKLSVFRAILQAFGALMFLSEAKGRGGKSIWASFTVNTLRSNAKRIHSLRGDREQSDTSCHQNYRLLALRESDDGSWRVLEISGWFFHHCVCVRMELGSSVLTSV
jgi:hypothetical protein